MKTHENNNRTFYVYNVQYLRFFLVQQYSRHRIFKIYIILRTFILIFPGLIMGHLSGAGLAGPI